MSRPVTTAAYTQPAGADAVVVDVNAVGDVSAGDSVYVSVGGYYIVKGVPDAYTLLLHNSDMLDNATPGATIPVGALITKLVLDFPVPYWGGAGPAGATGPQGVGIQGATGVGTQGATGAQGATGVAAAGSSSANTLLLSYSGATAYASADRVWYNGRAFQATSATTGTSPQDLLFADDFSGFCDGTVLNGGLYGYPSGSFFGSNFTTQNIPVSTAGGVPQISQSGSQAGFTMDPGVTTQFTDIAFLTLPAYTSGVSPWFAFPTNGSANGVLTFTSASTVNPVGIGIGGTGALTGGASASFAITGGTYTPIQSGDILRLGRTPTTVTVQVYHLGSWGGLITITLAGATFGASTTGFSVGLGGSGTMTITSLRSVVSPAIEDAKPWTLVPQPATRLHVTSNALTFHARFGRFFWSPGVLAANGTTSPMVWTNVHLTPQCHLLIRVMQTGVTSAVACDVTVSIISMGQGTARLQLANTAATGVTPFVAIGFEIHYPLSLT